jgi:hypothetical protein
MQHITRASNADAHPGMIQHGTIQCTSQEVQAKQEKKAAAKAKANADKKAKMQKVAELEVNVCKTGKATDRRAINPEDILTAPTWGKISRTEETDITDGTTVLFFEA